MGTIQGCHQGCHTRARTPIRMLVVSMSYESRLPTFFRLSLATLSLHPQSQSILTSPETRARSRSPESGLPAPVIVTRARTPSKLHPLFPVKSSNDRHPFFDLDALGLPKILKTLRISREILNERHPRPRHESTNAKASPNALARFR